MFIIEYIRRNKGLTQTEVAEQIGFKNSTPIVQVERGNRKPWPKIRKALAEFYGVDEQTLFDADGWPKKLEYDPVA